VAPQVGCELGPDSYAATRGALDSFAINTFTFVRVAELLAFKRCGIMRASNLE